MDEKTLLKLENQAFARIVMSFLLLVFIMSGLIIHIFLNDRINLLQRWIKFCTTVGTHGIWWSVSLGIAVCGICGIMTIRLVSVIVKEYRFYSSLQNYECMEMPLHVKTIVRSHQGLHSLCIVNDDTVFAFCYGFIRPNIYISKGFLNHLSQAELEAVLLHEQAHIKYHDTWKVFVAKIIMHVLFFVPTVQQLGSNYLMYKELLADQYAIRIMKRMEPLGSALVKIIHMNQTNRQRPYGINGFDDRINIRIRNVLGYETGESLFFAKKHTTYLLVLVVSFLFVFGTGCV
ncbi:M56 family metallopeptidase [Fodinisporobacter ferrooxydans]|uniref:M56 family metallopeptidase n=1 Tax=Fodinisporobacter ferrooxydans TaxID=2901836 RepID=A0ABY4CKW0_9BACL|nr:M56 family metallopeptidase [Alicyclobacillaceae bacterium MYW30-H2]